MKQDDQGKNSSRQDRLKSALRENLKRRKAQARGRADAVASAARDQASRRDAGDEASD